MIDALVREMKHQKVSTVHGRASHIQTEDGHVTGVILEDGRQFAAQTVILATGGASYPATGSTGDGYRLASELGHTVTDLQGSLVPLEAKGEDCPRMQGLALKNVRIKVVNQKKKVAYEGFGELLFTHFGLSGPLILSASDQAGQEPVHRHHRPETGVGGEKAGRTFGAGIPGAGQ